MKSEARREPPLPPADSSLKGQTSPLSGVIAEGLTRLAHAEGWAAQQNALDVLVGAMMKTGRTGASLELSPQPGVMDELAFTKLLGRHAGPDDQAKARVDAKQLASLAVVALGTEGLDKQRKGDREKQMEADLLEVRSALAEVLARAPEDRTARLEGLVKDLGWVAGVLSRSKSTQKVQPRVDAVAGMLKIMLRYQTGENAPRA